MELNVCPSCDAFVSGLWTECRSCGAPLREEQPEEQVHETSIDALPEIDDLLLPPRPFGQAPASSTSDDDDEDLVLPPAAKIRPRLSLDSSYDFDDLDEQPVPEPPAFEQPMVASSIAEQPSSELPAFERSIAAAPVAPVIPPAAEVTHVQDEPVDIQATPWFMNPPYNQPTDGREDSIEPQPVAAATPKPAAGRHFAPSALDELDVDELDVDEDDVDTQALKALEMGTREFVPQPQAHTDEPTEATSDANPTDDGTPEPVESRFGFGAANTAAAWTALSGVLSQREYNTGRIKRIAAGAVIAVVLVAGTSVGKQLVSAGGKDPVKAASVETTTTIPAWVSYADPQGRFTVDMPRTTETKGTTLSNMPAATTSGATADGKTQARVVVAELPKGQDWTKYDAAIRKVMEADAASMGANVESSPITTQNGHRQLDAHMTIDKKIVDARYFSTGGFMYAVSITTEKENGDPDSYSRVMNSFTLKK